MSATSPVCVIQGKVGLLSIVSILQLILLRLPFLIVIWHNDRSLWTSLVKLIVPLGNRLIIVDVDFPGIRNVNRQIVGTLEGLKCARMRFLGCEYLYKLRSDQTFLITRKKLNILKSYAEGRLILSNYNGYSSRLYPFSDMFMFGRSQEMYEFWNITPDTRTLSEIKLEHDSRYFQRQRTAEGYILGEYMKRVNWKPLWNQEDSLSFMEKYFTVFDYRFLGLIWWRKLYLKHRISYSEIFIEGKHA